MASTLITKNGTGSASPSSLSQGELAINVDSGKIFYGAKGGTAVSSSFTFDELTVEGNLTAQQYIVSSSVTYTTQSFSSGSTIFGDTQDDTHQFTGSISVTGSVTATSFVGDGSGLTGIDSAPEGTLSSSAQIASNISGAFDSVSASLASDIPTNNNELTNGAGYTTNTGTVTNVTVGSGLDISNSSTTPAISLDLTEITLSNGLDATATGLSLDLTEVGFGIGQANRLITNDGDGTVTAEAELTFDGITLDVDGKLDIDYGTNSSAVVDINNSVSSPMSQDHYALKVAGGQATGTPGGQTKAYGGYFTAGNTNGNNPDSIALYAQGHEDGAPNSYAAIFSGSAGGVVGINTTEPSVELDVSGDISASGDIVAGGDINIDGFPSVSASLASIPSPSKNRFQVNGGAFLSQTAQRALPFQGSLNESTIFSYTTTYMIPVDCKLLRVHTCSQGSAGTVTLKAYTIGDTVADNTAISNGTLLQSASVDNHNAGDPFEFTFGSTGTISKGKKFGLTVESDNNPNGFRFTAYFEEV